MVDPIQCPVIVPKVEIFEQRAAWRQVLGDRAPLAARAQDVHQAVHDFTDIDAAPAPTPLGRRYQRRDMSPFAVRHVARVAKLAAIIGASVLGCPHRSCPPLGENTLESHPTHMIQQLFGRTLRDDAEIASFERDRRLGSPQHSRYYFSFAQPAGALEDTVLYSFISSAAASENLEDR